MSNFDMLQQQLNSIGRTVDRMGSNGGVRKYKLTTQRESSGVVLKTEIRILPFDMANSDFPGVLEAFHSDLPHVKGLVPCLKVWGVECPICSVIERNGSRMDLSKQSTRVKGIFRVQVLRDPTNQNADPSISYFCSFTEKVFQTLSSWWGDPNRRTAFDAINGKSLELVREKENGSFTLDVSFNPVPIAYDEQGLKKMFDSYQDFNQIVKRPDDNMLNNLMSVASQFESTLGGRVFNGVSSGYAQPQQPPQYNQYQSSQPQPQQHNFGGGGLGGSNTQQQPPQRSQFQQGGFGGPAAPQNGFNSNVQQQVINNPPVVPVGFGGASQQAMQVVLPSSPVGGDGFVSQQSQEAARVEQEVSARNVKTQVAAQSEHNPKPSSNKPVCFGDTSQFQVSSDKCIECSYEFQCQKAVAARSNG